MRKITALVIDYEKEMFCPKCRSMTIHTIHGFAHHNRRYCCSQCSQEIQEEDIYGG